MSTSRQRRSATAGESRDGGIPATLGRQWPHPITDRLTIGGDCCRGSFDKRPRRCPNGAGRRVVPQDDLELADP